jgi:hypothetical protein
VRLGSSTKGAASKKSNPILPNLQFNMLRKLAGNHHQMANGKKNAKRTIQKDFPFVFY